MAKALRDPIPTSSIARLFNTEAANRAVSVPEPMTAPPELVTVAGVVGLTNAGPRLGELPMLVKREFIFSVTTDAAFTNVVDLFRRSTGTRLSGSHIARALCIGLARCMPSIEREARRLGRLKLPSNAKGREGDRDRFEDQLAAALVNGIRAAAAFESGEPSDTARGREERP